MTDNLKERAREACCMCGGRGGVTEDSGFGHYVSAKCPQCHGFGTEEVVDLIADALSESMGPDWSTRLGAQWVADALSDAGFAKALSLPTVSAEARNAVEWQPIETAPLDGTWILLGHKHPNHGWIMAAAHHFAGRWYGNGETVVWSSTHWRPLPEPPSLPPEEE